MSGTEPPTPPPADQPEASPPPPPRARVRQRSGFSLVWLIPLIAAIIAGYLGYRTLMQQGPLLTLTFKDANGLASGQTQVKYKAVALGTVESIDLSKDDSHVIVKVRMNEVGARFLNTHARFWVVRPHLTPADLSGLDTLVSGAFIAVDPGAPGGQRQTHFAGLPQPPGVRSDDPGQTYLLKTDSIGPLTTGSPVYYRDVRVGEVLGYDLGDGLGPVTVRIFVRDPYDKLVRPQSRFWNSSGVTAGLEGGAFHLQVQSLQAVISGAVTFDLPKAAEAAAPSPGSAIFHLYASKADAESAAFQNQIPIVSYFQSSVAGLGAGSPVDVLGIQVGEVTGVTLVLDPHGGKPQARVAMELQPERVLQAAQIAQYPKPADELQILVNQGMRAEIESSNLLTGQKDVALAVIPGAGPGTVTKEGDALVLPSQSGGLDNAMQTLSDISTKIDKIPFDQIGQNLNTLLKTANGTLGGPQMKETLAELAQTLKTTNATLTGINRNVLGSDSDIQRNFGQLLQQANEALRSIKLLTDYLDRHPEALLRGRAGQ